MDAKVFEATRKDLPGSRVFSPKFNPWNGTPKPLPAATGKSAISIEVFYAGIKELFMTAPYFTPLYWNTQKMYLG
jgi:hypothetical protein